MSDRRGDSAPDKRGTSRTKDRPVEGREAYDKRLRETLRDGPEKLKHDFRSATQRAREAETAETSKADGRPEARGSRPEAQGASDRAWVDRGVTDVKLGRVDRREYAGVWETQKTHKYSRKEIEDSLRSLPEVQKRIATGATPEQMHALRSSANAADRRLGRTYEAYYGGDAIRVEFTRDGRSSVINGRHRLDAADGLGMGELPMHVREQHEKSRGADR